MDENESLKSSLVEARQRLEHVQSFEVLSQGQVDKDLIRSDSDPFEESPLNNTQIASFSLTPPPNIMNAQYEMSMRKIIFLEKEAMRCAQLQEQVRQLEKALQVLTTQYNELLEVDGERLERIEELEQDVIDLRQLMKEQLLKGCLLFNTYKGRVLVGRGHAVCTTICSFSLCSRILGPDFLRASVCAVDLIDLTGQDVFTGRCCCGGQPAQLEANPAPAPRRGYFDSTKNARFCHFCELCCTSLQSAWSSNQEVKNLMMSST
ncbi:hypothetical protein Y032_0210g2139 [Ancylostoma ceylanicum]|uniref:TATA element modulatory factor 1 TATA binding domain-containing protein n=1 Tax=Ancylostoma ceylanicum TaxID=53326 RepID=A0A016SKA4_9BILA|nr:hypothetical protein Y032_0210g2139 [Ancylostoma ceylanicum]